VYINETLMYINEVLMVLLKVKDDSKRLAQPTTTG